MKRKLGIDAGCLRDKNTDLETLDKAHAAGFEAFTTGVITLDGVSALKNRAEALGMEFPFLHAPFRGKSAGINALWEAGDAYREIYDGIITSIDSASACDVPAVVLHVSSGWTPPPINDLGISRFDALVDYAAEKGVTIAFENLRCIGNLACFVDRYEFRDNVRFCFDCGHEHCYTKTISWLDIFTNKLVATHIHDNMSRADDDKVSDGDRHLLPFDGTYNYHEMMRKLNKYGYAGPLVLEVFRPMRADYKKMTDEEFLATAYDRIKRISMMGE